jgi:prophage regulatory protein
MTTALKAALQKKGEQTELRILRRKDLERLLGISRSQVYALVAAGRLPKPVPIFGRRSVGWLFHEIQEALRSSIEAARMVA